ncbi:MAG: hypothetical protein HYY34_03910 [Chloroflexi bacterium]|nr:hypothetical protein [Chloroflexota bacterium]
MSKRIRVIGIPPIAVAVLAAGLVAGARTASADFVCPVLPVPEQAAAHSNAGFITISGGDVSILPGKAGDGANSPVDVPDRATNDDGAGNPGGAHAVPGQPGYTAIWNTP